MIKRICGSMAVAGGVVLMLSLPVLSAKGEPPAGGKSDNRETCYGCHEEVRGLKEGSKHAKLECSLCHQKLDEHLENSDNRPVTLLEHAVCGKCHQDQLASFEKVNYEGAAHKEKGIPSGRSPMMDKLLAPYGFTIEHNEPRSHLFMVTDQFVVDRFAGGRFTYKNGWYSVDATGKTWDILKDRGAEFKMGETGKAGNPTCIQCKSTDHILKWKFMGDKDPRAKWDRTSDVIAVAKDTSNVMGCIHCHDPHGAQPRIVRDELINRIDQGAKMFAGKDGKTDLKVISFRDGFRKIGIMEKANATMMCAQCHVEYACGKGFEFDSGKPVGFEDRRTNHFPLVQVQDILAHYKKLNFYDFRHAVTGARLVKLQHPEVESYMGSVHERAGVTCADCHMPVVKNERGKKYRSHMMVRPHGNVKEACMRCHPQLTEEQKAYQMDAIQNYIRGKMRKAEYWLGQLIDTYAVAKRFGVDEAVLAQAREKHEEAHVLWEWWTAENSDGFHNPDLARESLAASITASKEAVAVLNKALDERGKK
ncbi:ammonia-forming cytochrome c nitrite reductase subunit c552 [Geobacter sp. DSM 9736]|uniref:ammonia-forming cytochrome c nitrite reductase subunit c552 n=1 Tax=Geobacter sp. DSM 9736 TaxID=1277350 RepID=UPI000B4FF004|nr:ammonia-forming cytochrome c nitrite reductase subunit c552 [Geobacter sp. DSM 9736]SNB46777.1 Formate-dependent nitrite reductase, cytochrome c552 subunit [Geobacter sp. DSM 9736]